MVKRYVFDTSFLAKGLVPPRRKKKDAILKEQLRQHATAKDYLEKVDAGSIEMHVPALALIEIATVVSRITNNENDARDALEYVKQNAAEIYYDAELLDSAIDVG